MKGTIHNILATGIYTSHTNLNKCRTRHDSMIISANAKKKPKMTIAFSLNAFISVQIDYFR